MTDINLEYVNPHDADECADGMNRLRAERDLARRVAVSLEQECAQLTSELAETRADLTLAINRLALYESRQERIEMPAGNIVPYVIDGQDEIGGVGV